MASLRCAAGRAANSSAIDRGAAPRSKSDDGLGHRCEDTNGNAGATRHITVTLKSRKAVQHMLVAPPRGATAC
eukprot:6369426-Prymnesium_polylepis.1